MPYFKLHGGHTKISKLPLHVTQNGTKRVDIFRSKGDAILGFAIGYPIGNRMRTDLTLDYFMKPSLSRKLPTQSNATKIKVSLTTIMLNGYFDIINSDGYKVFAGIGAGLARSGVKLYQKWEESS